MYDIILVDADMMAHRQYHAYKKQQLSTELNGQLIETGMLFGTLKTLITLQKRYDPKKIIFLYDDRECFRKQISSEYKSNRGPKSDSFLDQIRLTIGVLAFLGMRQVKAANYEADDLIATWVTQRIDEEQTLIVSTDKDLYCLLGNNVHMLLHNPKQRLFTAQDFKDRFGIDNSNFPIFLALTGDKTDCIMGLKGYGPKTATKLIIENNGDTKDIAKQLNSEDRKLFLLNTMLVALKRNIKTSEMLSLVRSDKWPLENFWTTMEQLKFKSMLLDKNKGILEVIYENNKSN